MSLAGSIQTGGQLHQVHDGAHAGGRRRPGGIYRHRAHPAGGGNPPHHQSGRGRPDCDLDYVPKVLRRQRVQAISNSLGFGGHNATLAVARWEEQQCWRGLKYRRSSRTGNPFCSLDQVVDLELGKPPGGLYHVDPPRLVVTMAISPATPSSPGCCR